MSLLLDAHGRYKEFSGKAIEQIPLLVGEERDLMTVADLAKEKVERSRPYPDWMNYPYDTGSGFAWSPRGKVKIVPDARHVLKKVNPHRRLTCWGAAEMEEEVYDTLSGWEIRTTELERYFGGKGLSDVEAKNDLVWGTLIEDRDLLINLVDVIYCESGRLRGRFDDNVNMDVMVAPLVSEVYAIQPLTFHGLKERSSLRLLPVNDTCGRFVGVLPENYEQGSEQDLEAVASAYLRNHGPGGS